MDQQPDFIQSYTILELESDASWEEVRQAYKRQAQIWHPDRFPESSPEQTEAEEQFQRIRNAFTTIEEYVRNKGTPPLLDQLLQEEELRAVQEQLESERHQESNSEEAASRNTPSKPQHMTAYEAQTIRPTAAARSQAFTRNKRPKEILKKLYAYIGLVLFLLSMGFIYTTWVKGPQNEDNASAEQAKALQSAYSQTSLVGATKDMAEAMAIQMSTLANENRAGGRKTELNQIEIKSVDPLKANSDVLADKHRSTIKKGLGKTSGSNSFTYGDSMTEVVRIHGPPSKMEKSKLYNTWHYGSSIIYFQNGKVKDWISHPSYPLATSLH